MTGISSRSIPLMQQLVAAAQSSSSTTSEPEEQPTSKTASTEVPSSDKATYDGNVSLSTTHTNPQEDNDDEEEEADVDMECANNSINNNDSSQIAANNCTRCYRLKKKCTRALPKCSNCTKSGADCEYVMRTKKRRRKITFRIVNDQLEGEPRPTTGIFPLVTEPTSGPSTLFSAFGDGGGSTTISLSEPTATKDKLVTVSSMLTNTNDPSSAVRKPSTSVSHKRNVSDNVTGGPVSRPKSKGREDTPLLVLGRIFKNKAATIENNQASSVIQDEFITMNSFLGETSLPQIFVVNYFYNYCLKYPFMNEEEFMTKFRNINFSKECIVPLDVYLVMAIGALVYDVQRGSKYFGKYFNERQIENIIDVINVNLDETSKELELESNIVVLLLLAIYGLIVNHKMLWDLIGILDRVVVQSELYKESESRYNNVLIQRLYWTVFNLDIEISLIRDKMPQLPTHRQWTIPFTESLYPKENLELVNLQMEMYEIVLQIVDLKSRRSVGKVTPEQVTDLLNSLLKSLDKWRKNIVAIYHTELATKTYLEECVAVCNLNYYFLLIEIDQMSSSESLQFTLQFLANLFTLMMNELVVAQTPLPPREPRRPPNILPPSPTEQDDGSHDNERSDATGTNASQILKFTNDIASSNLIVMLCHHKMYKVIRCSLKSLVRILEGTMKDKLSCTNQMFGIEELRLSEFSLNLQLMINLLKCIMNRVPDNDSIQLCLATLLKVNERLLKLEPIGECPARDALKQELAGIVKDNMKLFNY